MKKSRLLLLLLGIGMGVNAIAAPPQEFLTITVQGDGVVTSDPASIICQSDCTESYKKNSNITLTATAHPNGSFLGWEGDCTGTQPTCQVKITAPIKVTATFSIPTVTYPVPLLQTGQNKCWNEDGTEIDCSGTGQDGEHQAGVPFPLIDRFHDNGDGTVTDLATDLMWIQDRNCIRTRYPELTAPGASLGSVTWQQALDFVAGLNAGTYDCGAPPYNDWRLPNTKEIYSGLDFSQTSVVPPSPPFTNLVGSTWSSTSVSNEPTNVYIMWLNGRLHAIAKRYLSTLNAHPCWIVRGP